MNLRVGFALLLLLGLLSGCAGTGDRDLASSDPRDWSKIPDAVPKVEPKSKYGNPESYVVHGKRYHTKDSCKGYVQRGMASWYGKKFHGRSTSSGERYNMYAMTAAHKSLPLPTYARVTNVSNGRSAVVKINDRGPFHGNRIIDLSYSAALKLDVVRRGTAMVEVKAIDPRHPKSDHQNIFLAANAKADEAKTRTRGKDAVAHKMPAEGIPAPAAVETATRLAKAEKPRTPAKSVPAQVVKAEEPLVPESKVAVAARKEKPAKAAGSRMYLQVGAFGSRTNAEQVRRQLAHRIAEQVEVRMIDGSEAHWYKVHVGPLESRKSAKDLSQRLASLGLKESHIVVE